MRLDRCKQARDLLEASRAGEAISASTRSEVADHLRRCRGCQGQLALGLAVDAAAEEAAAPVDELRAERIFAGVRRQLATQEAAPVGRAAAEVPDQGAARRPWALVLSGAAAAAAILIAVFAVWLYQSDGDQPADPPPTSRGRWLARASGVQAWAAPGCEAGFAQGERSVELELHRGKLLVAFDRRHAPGPLRVRTSQVEVVVGGTVFFVEGLAQRTRVGVERGRVVVRPRDGIERSVAAGELLSISSKGHARRSLPAAQTRALQQRFGLASEDAPTPATAAAPPEPASLPTTAPVARQEPRPSRSRRSARARASRQASARSAGDKTKPAPSAPPARAADKQAVLAAIERANRHLRRGDGGAAQRVLRRALSAPGLDRGQREELQYLVATALRLQRRYREAAKVLGALAGSSRSHAARLALLEQARLLAYKLGERARAQALLARFTSEGSDALTQEAWLERCVLHLDQGAREQAHRCLDRFLKRFSKASPARLRKARQLRNRIEALRRR